MWLIGLGMLDIGVLFELDFNFVVTFQFIVKKSCNTLMI